MIIDKEMELCASGGQLFNASDGNDEYGSRPYDMMAAGNNAAKGTPIEVYWWMVDANSNVGTSYDIAVVADTDGAGGSEVVLLTDTILVAALTVAAGFRRLGTIRPGDITSSLRYLTAKVTTHGSTPTTGKMQMVLSKGPLAPQNAANVI